MSRLQTYHIYYGLFGGSRLAKAMHRQLADANFQYTPDTQNADIIIAHSAGCWQIATDCKPKLVLYVGAPLADPNPRQFFAATNRNVWHADTISMQMAIWRIFITCTFYAFRQPRRNYAIIKHAKQAQLRKFNNSQSIMINNRYDPWPASTKVSALLSSQDWSFLSLPGSHDNIWQQPEKYVEIIKHYAV